MTFDEMSRPPLVSIDLGVQNSRSEILLGTRLNRPARGLWFVPDGRIQKDGALDDVFSRLTFEELGHPAGHEFFA